MSPSLWARRKGTPAHSSEDREVKRLPFRTRISLGLSLSASAAGGTLPSSCFSSDTAPKPLLEQGKVASTRINRWRQVGGRGGSRTRVTYTRLQLTVRAFLSLNNLGFICQDKQTRMNLHTPYTTPLWRSLGEVDLKYGYPLTTGY